MSRGVDSYNSRIQQSHRHELVQLGNPNRANDEEEEVEDIANRMNEFGTNDGADGSSSSPRVARRSVGRSVAHREAVSALASVGSGERVDQLIADTIQQYQTAIQAATTTNTATDDATINNNQDGALTSSSSSSSTVDGVPSSLESAPALPTAPKRLFTNPNFHTSHVTPQQPGNEVPKPGTIGMKAVRALHSTVQHTLGAIQSKTSKILQDQERDLLRSFKTRLLEVSDELEKERKKNESGSVEWVARCKKLTEELDWVRELTESLSTENKALLKENRKATRAAQTQEQDRQFLIKQLVQVKKENARLRYLVEQQMKENEETRLSLHANSAAAGNGNGGHFESSQHLLPPATATPSYHSNLTTPTLGLKSIGIPKLKMASVQLGSTSTSLASSPSPSNVYASQPSTAPSRYSQSPTSHSVNSMLAFPPPSNMRASLLAAATTEPTTSITPMPPYAHTSRPDLLPPSTAPSRAITSIAMPESKLAQSSEKRFKAVIAKLKRQLDTEAARARTMRTAYMHEMQSKTQLQHLFKSCVDAVREQQLSNTRLKGAKSAAAATNTAAALPMLRPAPGITFTHPPPPLDPRSMDLTKEERIAIVEWFISQQSVLIFLFDRMFPITSDGSGVGGGGGHDMITNRFIEPTPLSPAHIFDSSPNDANAHSVPIQFDYAAYGVGQQQQQQSSHQQHSPTTHQHSSVVLNHFPSSAYSPSAFPHDSSYSITPSVELSDLANQPQLSPVQMQMRNKQLPHKPRMGSDEFKE